MGYEILKTARSTAAFARLFIDKFGDTPTKKKKLLENTGTTLDALNAKDVFFSAFEFRQLVKNINALEGENWVLRFPALWRLNSVGDFTRLIKNCPSVGEALNTLMEFGHLLEHTHYYEQFDTAKSRHILFNIVLPEDGTAKPLLEIIAINFYGLLTQILDEAPTEIEIWFDFERPPYANLYKNVFQCSVKFGQKYCAVILPHYICDLPIADADSRNFTQSLKSLRQAKNDVGLKLQGEPALIDSVKKYISTHIKERPGVDQTAKALGFSRRSLTRKLTKSGTSHRDILDEISKERATKLLAEGRYSRTEIADQLGYTDPTSFSRALKRWRNSQ